MSEPNKIQFLGFQVDRMNWEETLETIHQAIVSKKPVQHCVLNAYKIYLAHHQPRLREIINHCGMLQADGVSIVWAGRWLGLPSVPRIPGVDLMGKLLSRADREKYRVFFLGAGEAVLDRMLSHIRKQYPGLVIAGSQNGYFSETENEKVVEKIRDSRADILFVGISSPKKEYWLAENMKKIDVPFCMGVGGSFDVMAGISRRSPRWIQTIGLEWFYRWIQEPRRLTRRYLVGNSLFLSLVIREWIRLKLAPSSSHGHF